MPAFAHSTSNTSRRRCGNIVYASSKENDAFVSNYLYCGKTKTSEVEVLEDSEPICSGSAPCQDANTPCGEIAVDSCISTFLDNTLKFLPRKTPEGKKQLSLSRNGSKQPQRSRSATWYDVANEKFDLLLENFLGNDHKAGEQSRLAYEAPALKERKQNEPQQGPPINSEIVYDEDFGGVVYVPSFGSQSGHFSGTPSLSETSTRQQREKQQEQQQQQQQQQHTRKARNQRARGGRVVESFSLGSPDSSEHELFQQKRRLMVSQHTM